MEEMIFAVQSHFCTSPKAPGRPEEEEENCLVGAVWTLARVPAAAHVHQTRPGSALKEGTLEEEAGDL